VHPTGIPYNPQGQAMVERAHQTLKHQIAKLRQGEFKYSSPHHVLHHVLFVINHLNVDTQGKTAMMRHRIPEGATTRPLVRWKDFLTREWKGQGKPEWAPICPTNYSLALCFISFCKSNNKEKIGSLILWNISSLNMRKQPYNILGVSQKIEGTVSQMLKSPNNYS